MQKLKMQKMTFTTHLYVSVAVPLEKYLEVLIEWLIKSSNCKLNLSLTSFVSNIMADVCHYRLSNV